MKQGGIQALETMLFTLDEVNPVLQNSVGFTLGAHILDDCDKDTYGLEQAVAFIKGKPFPYLSSFISIPIEICLPITSRIFMNGHLKWMNVSLSINWTYVMF